MTSLLPPSLLATAAPLPNAPQLSTRGTAASNENSFSRQLEQSRRAHAQENARPAPQAKPAAPPAGPPAAPTHRPPAKPDAGARSEAARTARAAPPQERAVPAEADSTRPEPEAEAKAEASTDPEATDPTGVDLLALMGLPPDALASAPVDAALAASLAPAVPLAPVPPASVPTTSTAADAATPDTTRLAGTASTATGAGALPQALRLPAQAGARDAPEPTAKATPEPGAWQQAQAAAVLAEGAGNLQDTIDMRPVEPAAASDRALAGPGLGGLTGATRHAGQTGDVATVNLATPATSAEFRAALGAQVSYFARAGVQQAELHLNPADMGPVSIQIVVDGQQAQVNFGADSALTRQIIESGMPELAGAMRDAGLTLTGGGVSQHAGGQRQDANGNGAAGASASNALSGTRSDDGTDPLIEQTRRSVVRSSQGGVDLYA